MTLYHVSNFQLNNSKSLVENIMTGHVDSISPEFASRRDSDEDNSIISGDDNDISNFVANSLFQMVLSEQKITWPVDSSGTCSNLSTPISFDLMVKFR